MTLADGSETGGSGHGGAEESPTGFQSTPNTSGGDSQDIYCDPDAEEVLWWGRTHWQHYLGRVLVWLLMVAGAGSLAIWVIAARGDEGQRGTIILYGLGGFALLSGFLILGKICVIIFSSRYRLTTQRLFIGRGLFSQTVDQTELIRIDDVRLHRTFMDRICGLGTVEVISTDASDARLLITGIRNAENVAESIRRTIQFLRRRSLYVEHI